MSNQIAVHLRENQETLEKVFDGFSENKSVNLLKHAEPIVQSLVDQLELSANNLSALVTAFANEVLSKFPESESQSFREFCKVVESWAVSNELQSLKSLQVQRVFLQHLDNSIKQYKVLLKQTKDEDEIDVIKQLLKLLTDKRKSIKNLTPASEVNFSFRSEPTLTEEKGIQEIFNFYNKQHLMLGKYPTFDYIGEVLAVLDSGSFLHFCRDFGIYSDQRQKSQRTLTRKELLDIFKRCSTLQKNMHFEEFKRSLDEMAILYFNEDYERLVSVPCSHLGINEKRIMLYEVMRCGDLRHVHKTCKPVGKAFCASLDKNPRIPVEEGSRNYKFKVSEEKKEQLERFRKEREEKKRMEQETKVKESQEKAKAAKRRIKEKHELEDMGKRKDAISIQNLNKFRYEDIADDDLNQLIS